MKDAFNYLLLKYPKLKGVVTADSDGQHSIKDIEKVSNEILKHPDSLILGCRDLKMFLQEINLVIKSLGVFLKLL